MVRLYWLCLCSRFLFTKQGSLAIIVAQVTNQRLFCRIFASSKKLRNSRIKNTRLNEPRSSTKESGNLVWLLRVKHIWISSEPWSARLVNCQLCWNLKKVLRRWKIIRLVVSRFRFYEKSSLKKAFRFWIKASVLICKLHSLLYALYMLHPR